MTTTHALDGTDFVPTIHHDTYEYINPSQFNLNDKAILITGASKGIGSATAISFAKAGVSLIAIAARSPLESLKTSIETAAKEIGREIPKVLCLEMDVADETSVKIAAEKVESEFGRLDILINNAGFLEPFRKILDGDSGDWVRAWEINVFGVYFVTKAFLPLLMKSSSAKNCLKTIINTSSIGANMTSGGPGGSGYRSAKLAVERFTEFIGWEYPDVLAYSIHPGGVKTELAAGMGKEMEFVLVDEVGLAADTTVWLGAVRRDWLKGRFVSVCWDMGEFLGRREVVERGDLLKVRLRVD